MKRAIRLILVLLLLTTLTAAVALGEADVQTITETIPDAVYLADEAMDSDEAMEGYFMGLLGLGGSGRLFQPRNVGGDLTGNNSIIYNYLKGEIVKVAAGTLASTEFQVPLTVLGATGKYTAKDLGVSAIIGDDNRITAEASKAITDKIRFDVSLITKALLWDMPYELYWFNKTQSVRASYPQLRASYTSAHTNDCIFFDSPMVFRFPVAEEYSSGEYTFNTSLTATAQRAAENARTVINRYAGDSDYAKLLGYKESICGLASYNRSAADGEAAYGNPWQLIWVFDGDTSTTVVCEGYAKAFQYLCDMSDFEDDRITCYCVTGNLIKSSSSEGHMWNIVRMPNGLNYLVDLTNCDTGTRGAPDKLFMVGCANGSATSGYVFENVGSLTYSYKDATTNLFTTAELTLSPNSYLDDSTLPIKAAYFPDSALRNCISDQCDRNADGHLSAEEIAAALTLDLNGKGVASLSGIELLTSLTSLDCADNSLTELDVTLIPGVTVLHCEGNLFTSLDLTGHPMLLSVVRLSNRSWADGVKTYSTSRRTLSCDIDVSLLIGRQIESTLTLPAALRSISKSVFEGCSANRIILPEGCAAIGARAFANSPSLWEIVIPESVTSIAEDVFAGSEEVTIISSSSSIRSWARDHGLASRKG